MSQFRNQWPIRWRVQVGVEGRIARVPVHVGRRWCRPTRKMKRDRKRRDTWRLLLLPHGAQHGHRYLVKPVRRVVHLCVAVVANFPLTQLPVLPGVSESRLRHTLLFSTSS